MPVETEDDAAQTPRPNYFHTSDLGAILAGVTSGAAGAYAYYSDMLRPLAHSFTIWIVLVVAVTAGAPRRRAAIRAVGALIAAVLAFYWGKALVYGIKYAGMPYQVDVATTVLWCALAVAGGLLAGFLLSAIGRTDTRGTVATATVVGLLAADVVRQSGRSGIGVLLLATVVAIGFVGYRGIRSVRPRNPDCSLRNPAGRSRLHGCVGAGHHRGSPDQTRALALTASGYLVKTPPRPARASQPFVPIRHSGSQFRRETSVQRV